MNKREYLLVLLDVAAMSTIGHCNCVPMLTKMDEPLDIHWSRLLPEGYRPTTVTVSKDCADRYFVSFQIEEDIESLPVVNKQVGLDLGLKSMVVLSTGESIGNPRYFVKDE